MLKIKFPSGVSDEFQLMKKDICKGSFLSQKYGFFFLFWLVKCVRINRRESDVILETASSSLDSNFWSNYFFFCLSAADLMVSADPEGYVSLSPSHPSPLMQLPLASSPPEESDLHQSFKKNTTADSTATPVFYEPLFGQTKPFSPRPIPAIHCNSEKPQSSKRSTKIPQNIHLEAFVAPADLNTSLDSNQGATLAFPSTTWSSCPSPQRTTPHSGSLAKLTPSPPMSRMESHRWPVLPPISPVRGEKWAWPHMCRSQPPPCPTLHSYPLSEGPDCPEQGWTSTPRQRDLVRQRNQSLFPQWGLQMLLPPSAHCESSAVSLFFLTSSHHIINNT